MCGVVVCAYVCCVCMCVCYLKMYVLTHVFRCTCGCAHAHVSVLECLRVFGCACDCSCDCLCDLLWNLRRATAHKDMACTDDHNRRIHMHARANNQNIIETHKHQHVQQRDCAHTLSQPNTRMQYHIPTNSRNCRTRAQPTRHRTSHATLCNKNTQTHTHTLDTHKLFWSM